MDFQLVQLDWLFVGSEGKNGNGLAFIRGGSMKDDKIQAQCGPSSYSATGKSIAEKIIIAQMKINEIKNCWNGGGGAGKR